MLGATPRVRIETPSLQGSINLKGARIDDLVLVAQRETIAKQFAAGAAAVAGRRAGAYFASFGWTGEGVQAPRADAVWTASAPVLRPASR